MTTSTQPRPPHGHRRPTSRSGEPAGRSARPEPAGAPIVVAIDDSPEARAASHAAVRLARQTASTLVFMQPVLVAGRVAPAAA